MKRIGMSRKMVVALSVAALTAVAGCNKGADSTTGGTAGATADAPEAKAAAADLDPILADPKVGDLYAAELTAFSGFNFNSNNGSGSAQDKAYGLLKVVEVTPERVVVITETGAYPRPQGARNDLRGNLASITWDESEKIPVNRADFARLVAEEKILETRRLSGSN
jgi:hypothetical protein